MSDPKTEIMQGDAGQDAASPLAWARADETPHAFLRRVTRPWHDRVEAAFAPFDLQTREGMSGFLLRQAAAVWSLEDALERSGVARWLADWSTRRRAAALAADLLHLGIEPPSAADVPDFATQFDLLGALYVLEGSKLGGRVLYRHAQASPDPVVRSASRFLGHRHEHGWTRFLAVLDAVPRETRTWVGLHHGASAAFATFDVAARSRHVHNFAIVATCSNPVHQVHA